MRLTWGQAAAWRARRHHLDERVPAAQMLDVVARLGGIHAQILSSAELSLWARVDGLKADDVARALWDDRTLVKTWAMRGTLHLLPTAEYAMWQAALSRYDHYTKPRWFRGFRVTEDEMTRLWSAAAAALDAGEPLTRAELAAAVTDTTGAADLGEKVASSWGSLLKPLSYRGELCFASNAGQNVRFSSPRRWLGKRLGPTVDPDEAALEVTRRFVTAYGPATRQHYAHWWGVISAAAAGRLLAALGDEVTTVDVEGWSPAYVPAGALDELAAYRGVRATQAGRSVRLLPAFDQYVISASSHAVHLLPDESFRPRIYRPQAWLSPVVVVEGRFAGVWRHERKGRRLLVTVEPFGRLPAWARKGVAAESERLAAFLGGSLELSTTDAP